MRLKNPRFVCGRQELWRFDEQDLERMAVGGWCRVPASAGSALNIQTQAKDEIDIKFTADDFHPERISGSVPDKPASEETPQVEQETGDEKSGHSS
jgi:hypothetical protein